METHTGIRFANHLGNILLRVVGNVFDSSQLKSTRHTRSRFARHLENIPQVAKKGGCRLFRIAQLVTIDVERHTSRV